MHLRRLVALLLLFAACKRNAPAVEVDGDDDDRGRKKSSAKSTSDAEAKSKSKPSEGDVVHFQSSSGRFAIDYPPGSTTSPEQVQTVPSEAGPLTMHIFQVIAKDEWFGVMYSDYPKSVVASKGAARTLLDVQGGVLAGIPAKLEKDSSGVRNALPYRSFTFDALPSATNPATGYGKFVVMLLGDRLYQVAYIGPDRATFGAQKVKDFFASFTITPP